MSATTSTAPPSPAVRAAEPAPALSRDARRARGPFGALLDLFSNVTFGIVLLTILFVYMAIGSAGVLYPIAPNIFSAESWTHVQLRQWRPFEMTEFEWFHWWPFEVLMGLIAANIVVTTLRRIRLSVVNLGVWLIHGGVLTLMLGCVIYFATKVEGEAPVVRRKLVAELVAKAADGTETVTDRAEVIASPGMRASLGEGDRAYQLEVVDIDPKWELRTAGHEGETAYSVNVSVRSPERQFVRQLLAERPELTEDIVLTQDSHQPMQRAVKALGTPLVDESLRLSLEYAPQRWFYLRPELEKCWALYVRPLGAASWTERKIVGVPRYNEAVASRDQVFEMSGDAPLVPHAIDVAVPPAGPDDPLPDLTFRVTGYVPYAVTRSRVEQGGPSAPLNPAATIEVIGTEGDQTGNRTEYRLEALNSRANKGDGGLVQFRYAPDPAALERLRFPPTLILRIPSQGIESREPVREIAVGNPDAPFVSITRGDEDTGYAYRVVAVQDDIALTSGTASVAILELTTPNGRFRRWVFDDPRLTRDVTETNLRDPHAVAEILDDSIEVDYEPGHGIALVTLVAGPDPDVLHLITTLGGDAADVREVRVGEAITLPAGIALRVSSYTSRAVRDTRPTIIPRSQRDRDAGVQFAQIRLEVPGGSATWLPFHMYVFDSERDVLRRARFTPTVIQLPDGKMVEVLFSRQRRQLPAEVALDEFVLTAHVGGFTGESATIRDYTSQIRFRERDGAWSEPVSVSVNEPVEWGGYSYFQAQWDPPSEAQQDGERASRGMNYTVLGVGNRHGVNVMLAGCIIAALGMCYAFYVKPILKRRRQVAVLATAPSRAATAGGAP